MKGLKLVVIGAGSSYTPELMEGIIRRKDEFPVRELWLVDIEEGREKMAIIAGLTRRMLKKMSWTSRCLKPSIGGQRWQGQTSSVPSSELAAWMRGLVMKGYR